MQTLASNTLARPLGAPLGMGGRSDSLEYYQQRKNLFGSSIIQYIPVLDTSGTVATDVSGNGRNGAYTNVTLGQAGVGGEPSGAFNGSTSYLDHYSAGYGAAFNGAEGSLSLLVKVSGIADWTDATQRYFASLLADTNNYLKISKSNTANYMMWEYKAGGVTLTRYKSEMYAVDFMHLFFTWSKTGNRARSFYNGDQWLADLTNLGNWAGALASYNTVIGAAYKLPANVHKGNICEVMTLDRAATAEEVEQDYRIFFNRLTLSVLGDSITQAEGSWAARLAQTHNQGHIRYNKYAVAGHSIMANMDAQTLSAADDNADLIIIELGTNDNNAGDMGALQAKVESNIDALRTSNPSATIFYMNVLPRFDGVDKSNIRAAIVAACAAKSVTCWDTVTDPWILEADTQADKYHLNDTGYAKITAEVLERLSTANGH
jgi:lysophospholipase L1-like esterase